MKPFAEVPVIPLWIFMLPRYDGQSCFAGYLLETG